MKHYNPIYFLDVFFKQINLCADPTMKFFGALKAFEIPLHTKQDFD